MTEQDTERRVRREIADEIAASAALIRAGAADCASIQYARRIAAADALDSAAQMARGE